MLETRKRKERILQAESSILHLQSTIDKNLKLKEEANLELVRINRELSDISQSEKIVAKLTPKYQEYIQKRKDLVDVTEQALQYDKILLNKVKLETSINSDRDMLNSNIKRLDSELSELSSEREICNKEIENLNHLKEEEILLSNNITDSGNFEMGLEDVSDKLSNIKSEIISIHKEISKQQSELDTVLRLRQDAVCPYCKQKLDQQHISELENKFLQRKDFLENKLGQMEKELQENQYKKNGFLDRIKKVDSNKSELQKIQIQIAKLNVVQKSIKLLDLKIDEKNSDKRSMQAKLQDNYFLEKVKKLDELSDKLSRLYSYKMSYDSLTKMVNAYQKTNLESTYVEHSNFVKSKERNIEEKRVKEKMLMELDDEIFAQSKKLDEMKAIYQDSREVENKLKKLELEKLSFENELVRKKENLAMRRSEHDNNLKNIEAINKKINDLEERVDKIAYTDQIGVWLNQHFIPCLEQIESQVLISVREEFNKLFQKWFYLLIEVGDIDVEIDEYFTPIVNQSGYHLEVDSLSGGEKTSIALAYRLALNEIIRRIIMLDDNLLILDEPTDGFSKEQLIQIKIVLEELSAAQVIIVSHEKELEGFVETIFRVVKESEKSQVELAA
jgi:exonuclease SbcC